MESLFPAWSKPCQRPFFITEQCPSSAALRGETKTGPPGGVCKERLVEKQIPDYHPLSLDHSLLPTLPSSSVR